MTIPSFLVSRCRTVLLCLSLALLAITGSVRADDVPKFSDPDVNAFVKSYTEFTDEYSAVMKDYMAAMKNNDTAKMQLSAKQVQDIQTKSADIQSKAATVGSKVKPDEAQKFTDYMKACVQRITDATKQ